ncbi:hypothetical protein DPMN_144177 [Dreissena polymorpha]|uniref:Fibronectin type-III domain-containing protein n=1 Tax=Dreissena polymorpha TaxID=45954 RepID=A0A9D4JPZ3_DREPO|nr:hypothetical protein DPMN_144177 [Dreissena polymorpha]
MDLAPDTTYVFLVRAVNMYGMGGPSPLSDKIRTLAKGEASYLSHQWSISQKTRSMRG